VSDRPSFTVEYIEPVTIDAEPLPEEFSARSLKRSLLILGGIVAAIAAAILLLPGLGELRESFSGAEPRWLAVAVLLELASCASYVFVFRGVFCDRMSWRTSTEIGLSELAANSLLSVGGAGGLALGAWILRRGGLPAAFIAQRTVAFFLLTSLANVTFLAIGGGPELEPLRARVAAARVPPGRFVLTGPQSHDRVPLLLALPDVGVAPFVPSVYAPLRTFGFYWSPLKVFEYMALGLPVVTLDIPPLHTIIRAGHEGLLYREGDLNMLTTHLLSLADDPAARARMGVAARARVVAHYSWDAHCEQLERVLYEAMSDER